MIQQCNTHGILTNTSQKEMGSSPEFRREFHGPRVLHTQPTLADLPQMVGKHHGGPVSRQQSFGVGCAPWSWMGLVSTAGFVPWIPRYVQKKPREKRVYHK